VAWSVGIVAIHVETVPVAVLSRLKQRLTEIGVSLDALSREERASPATGEGREAGALEVSPLWDSLRESPMRLHVGGWCFLYRIDRTEKAIAVIDCFEVPT
jgi:hypothetical protein